MHTVLLEKKDGIATITFNRPGSLNALNRELVEDALAAFADAGADEDIRVVVLTGAGKAFCAGGDLAYMRDHVKTNAEVYAFISLAGTLTRTICTLPKPVIGMINGVAAGAGANYMLACDITVCAASFRFGQSFAKVGLVPDGGGHYLLPRLIGLPRAKELMFTGKLLTAAEAQAIGLVNHVVDAEQLAETTYALARELAAGPPIALAMIKKNLTAGMENSLDSILELEATAQTTVMMTADAQEGMSAFIERRAPRFTGR